jgi:hypothetical protein
MDPQKPRFGFGGAIFNIDPEWRERAAGVFPGENARQPMDSVARLVPEDQGNGLPRLPVRGLIRECQPDYIKVRLTTLTNY